MDSLRYWVDVMHVDGFRFDLASALGREAHGFDPASGFFDAVRQDPVLAPVKLIAEPWDIGPGGYQLGHFPPGWSEWNDRYRDTMRRFWRGEAGLMPEFARRLHGSSDVFEHSRRGPAASINYITSHDGFTLADTVSYAHTHNEANGENNNDGHRANFSDNNGCEGPTDDEAVLALRRRQRRNMLTTLFLSQGTPMLLAGDERGQSQQGNNNAYCQDNTVTWLDWAFADSGDRAFLEFVKGLIALRKTYPELRCPRFVHGTERAVSNGLSDIAWINTDGGAMLEQHWREQEVHCVGLLLDGNAMYGARPLAQEFPLHTLLAVFNASRHGVKFTLPANGHEGHWRLVLDTVEATLPANSDAVQRGEHIVIEPMSIRLYEFHDKVS
jgi:glycogen operon protein